MCLSVSKASLSGQNRRSDIDIERWNFSRRMKDSNPTTTESLLQVFLWVSRDNWQVLTQENPQVLLLVLLMEARGAQVLRGGCWHLLMLATLVRGRSYARRMATAVVPCSFTAPADPAGMVQKQEWWPLSPSLAVLGCHSLSGVKNTELSLKLLLWLSVLTLLSQEVKTSCHYLHNWEALGKVRRLYGRTETSHFLPFLCYLSTLALQKLLPRKQCPCKEMPQGSPAHQFCILGWLHQDCYVLLDLCICWTAPSFCENPRAHSKGWHCHKEASKWNGRHYRVRRHLLCPPSDTDLLLIAGTSGLLERNNTLVLAFWGTVINQMLFT